VTLDKCGDRREFHQSPLVEKLGDVSSVPEFAPRERVHYRVERRFSTASVPGLLHATINGRSSILR
jgi:hypothetical protein